MVVAGEEEAARVLVPEVRHGAVHQPRRRLQIGAVLDGFEDVEQAGGEKDVVVEVAVQLGDAVLATC